MYQVRELPPLRVHASITTPNGRVYRWGADERRPENVPSSLSFSTVMPGGFETCEMNLPRKTGAVFPDMTRLSTISLYGAGEQVGEFRLEKAPRVSGDEVSISPQAVGWQAHLEDDPEAMECYIDRDLTHWQDSGRARKLADYVNFQQLGDLGTDPDPTTGIPALNLTFAGTGATINISTEAWYDAGPGANVASIYYDFTSTGTTSSYVLLIGSSTDDAGTSTSLTGDLMTATDGSGANTTSPTVSRFGLIWFYASGLTPTEIDHTVMVRRLTVWGNSGIPQQGTAPADGVYASDVIADAVSRWAPALNVTADSITPTAFIVPQAEYRDPTTVAAILQDINRFSLNDWAVWTDKTFFYHPRGARGKKWRAMVAPAKLQETGPQVDRLHNSAIISYQDVDGTTKTVGPTGSLCDSTDADLLDTDPLNPVNQLGLKRPALLDMGIVSTATAATEVGRQFLQRSKELDQSGQAELVGHVRDDHGVMFPASRVRAGDTISFTDAADPSYRRIVRTQYDHDSRTTTLDLDSPPEGMADLLERLGVALTVGTSIPHAAGGGLSGSLTNVGF